MKTLSITLALMCGCFFISVPAQGQPVAIRTLAGYSGGRALDGQGSTARFRHPHGLALDSAGNIYVADTDNHTIRKITPAGSVSTIAGEAGVSGTNNGVGNTAHFSKPQGVAVDNNGNVYVADTGNHVIRKISTTGIVSTLAGVSGAIGNQDGSTSARFHQPLALAVDSFGQVFVADFGNGLIRKITPDGNVSTVAAVPGPQGLAMSNDNLLYVADYASSTVLKVTTSGNVSPWAGSPNIFGNTDAAGTNASFYHPAAVAVDGSGTVYVCDEFNSTVRKVTSSANVSTLAGQTAMMGSNDGGTNARFFHPQGVIVDSESNIFVADTENSTIRKLSPDGLVTTFVGSPSSASVDGSRGNARFSSPGGLVLNAAGDIYVVDSQNSIVRKVTPSGFVTTIAGSPNILGATDGNGTNALFNAPANILVNGANLLVGDTGNSVIRQISPEGVVTTVAGFPGHHGYVDGALAEAEFHNPEGMAMDSTGNLFVADTMNHVIRKLSPDGFVATIAGRGERSGSADGTNSLARFNYPKGLAIDSSGNIYVSDYFNHAIRKITLLGTSYVTTTIAGLCGQTGSLDGTNQFARFFGPRGIAVDNSGHLYVVDSGNHCIRALTASGTNWIVSTIAGTGGMNGAADGVGSSARFESPSGIAVDTMGYLYVADTANNEVRVTRMIPPELRIARSANQSVTLRWSSLDIGFVLEKTSALDAQWNLLSGADVSGDDFVTTNAINSANVFYRLRLP
jgi:sugar lactone lactonase YvrE